MYVVERFIILHLDLFPGTRRIQHDGDASDEELCEHILYYNELGVGRSYPYTSRCCYNCESAAKFFGLCTALYSIQTTVDTQLLHSDDNGHCISSADKIATQEVYLSSCTLVFIPLERLPEGEILAVAQVKRCSSTGIQVVQDGHCTKIELSPQRIRQSIQKAHELFVSMNRSSIQQTLTDQNAIENDSKVKSDTNTVQNQIGSVNVYDLQQQSREPRIRNENVQDDNERNELEQNIAALDTLPDDVEPLKELRTDLKYYYDTFLRDIAVSE